MQQTYGLDIDEMGLCGAQTTKQVMRAASLCAQLPPNSRVVAAFDPAASWTVGDHLLRIVEYKLSLLTWALSGAGGDPPEPIEAPGDIEAATQRASELAADMELVALTIPGFVQQEEQG